MSDEIEKLKAEVREIQTSQEMLFEMVEVVESGIQSDMAKGFKKLDDTLQILLDEQKAYSRRIQNLEEKASD